MRRLRPLSEHEVYARCYGSVDGNVRVLRPLRPPPELRTSGEALRAHFERRLDAREPEAA